MTLHFIPLLWVLIPLLSVVSSLFQSRTAESHSSSLVRRYKNGEVLNYHMVGSNQEHNETIRYEADAKSIVTKDASGHFVEKFQWSGLSFNGQPVPLPTSASNFRQHLSLDPAVLPSLPDFSHVTPMLIGPSADLLTFYSDLWLAIKQGTLLLSGDHV